MSAGRIVSLLGPTQGHISDKENIKAMYILDMMYKKIVLRTLRGPYKWSQLAVFGPILSSHSMTTSFIKGPELMINQSSSRKLA